jgi:hypothetical protein
MPTELLSSGGTLISVTQNVVYALPVCRALLTCDTAAATFVQSNDPAFGVSVPLAISAAGEAEIGGGFIKCTSGNVKITIKKR